MPFFKVWSGLGKESKKKSLVANSLEDLLKKSASKLAIQENVSRVYLEDGTEIDDDETLLSLDKGTVLVVCKEFENVDTKITETGKAQFSDLDNGISSGPSSGSEEKVELTEEKISSGLISSDEEKVESSNKSKSSESTVELLMSSTFTHSKMKGLKIYSNQDIKSASSEMERRYRKFWNEKAEQLCREPATKNKTKATLHGIIDVAWTLRKTTMLESSVNVLMAEEKTLFAKKMLAHGRRLGNQKKSTIIKNVERMMVAHTQMESLDKELESLKEQGGNNKDLSTKFCLMEPTLNSNEHKRLFQNLSNRKS